MTKKQQLAGILSTALCISLVACGGSQERTKIGDRKSARDKVQNSKLLKLDLVIKSCPTESAKKDDSKKILSLDGLSKSLTTAEANTLFASSFTSRIRITGANGDDLKNKQLSQTFLLKYGLQHNSAPLKEMAPSFLNIVSEDCQRVIMPMPELNEEPSLFFQMARLDMEYLNTFAALATPEEFATEKDSKNAEEETPSTKDKTTDKNEETLPKTASNTVEFFIDREASSNNMLVLRHPDNKIKVIVKLVSEETLQVITETPESLVACGEAHSFQLRNEATLVWGKSWQEPVTIDYELYQTMLDLSNNNKLLSSGAQENQGGRRAKGLSSQSVNLPEAFIGQYDEAIDQFHNKQSNAFDIQPVNCD